MTRVDSFLPDLRGYLLDFDHQKAIADWSSSEADADASTLLDSFQTGTYRQYSWSASAFFVASAAAVLLSFVFHVVWTSCCFACGCRKRELGKRQTNYAKYQKILWGLSMVICFAAAVAAAVWTLLVVHSDVSPLATEAVVIINDTLVANISEFEVALLTPLDRLIGDGYQDSSGRQIWLEDLQDAAVNDLASHTFLDNQSYARDVVSEPVLAIVNSLLEYSLLFPTAIDNLTDCASVNITPSAVSRMTVGGETSCFRCKPCSAITDVVVATADYWRRNPFQVQMDMLTSKRQLRGFGESRASLAPAIRTFLDRMHSSASSARTQMQRIAARMDEIATQTRQLTVYALFALLGLGGATLLLGVGGFAHGIVTNKRLISRSTCCIAELTVLLAIVLTGVLYAIVWMSHDGVVAVQLLNNDVSTFESSANSVEDLQLILFDKNLVDAGGMNVTLAFSDTLRVLPLPTQYNDDPDRVNISQLYYLTSLFALEEATDDIPTALVSFFDWSEQFVELRHELLMTLAFGNSSVRSPYNQTIHQDLLNSTVAALIDPDLDSQPATDNDLIEIQQVFNASWRGVDDAGVRQNEQIAATWYALARLYVQKQRLKDYITAVHDIVTSVHPLLGKDVSLLVPGLRLSSNVVRLSSNVVRLVTEELIVLTAAMEDAEFQLKAPVEFVSDAIRQAKIKDCAFDGNCRTLRTAEHYARRYAQPLTCCAN